MKKNNQKKSFFHLWPIYLVIIFAVGFVFSWAIDLKTAPKKEEKLDFCMCLNNLDVSGLTTRIKENNTHELKEINYQKLFPNLVQFDQLYFALEQNVDFFVIPNGILDNKFTTYYRYFAPLTNEYITNNLGSGVETYTYEDKIYGIKIYDQATDKGLSSDLIQYKNATIDKKDFYLFLNKNSVHHETTKTCPSFYDVVKSLIHEEK